MKKFLAIYLGSDSGSALRTVRSGAPSRKSERIWTGGLQACGIGGLKDAAFSR